MKKFIYGGFSGHYKANLHSHSTVSDGNLSPEEMKKFYKDHGYSVLAVTDHNLLNGYGHLSETDFLMLTGYEVDMTERKYKDNPHNKTVHMNAYPPVGDEVRQVLFHTDNLARMRKLHPDTDYGYVKYFGEQYKRTYCPEDINKFISECKSHGYLTTVNHPVWSMNDPEEFKDIDEDLFAIEIINGGCLASGYGEHTTVFWDYLLRHGKRVFCTATDDNHNRFPYGTGRCDSFRGFDVINAPSLEYEDIFEALKNGNFYASSGAYIDEVCYEDGKITVKCPGARRISLVCGVRRYKTEVMTYEGRPITEASFEVRPEDLYARVEVEDLSGNKAYSQPFFFEI